jgi:hypothetical protein
MYLKQKANNNYSLSLAFLFIILLDELCKVRGVHIAIYSHSSSNGFEYCTRVFLSI